MAIIIPNGSPPDGYYWWIPKDIRIKEQPILMQRGEIYVCGSDIDEPETDDLYLELNTDRIKIAKDKGVWE